MLLSMTGFGKAIVELPNKKITVEITQQQAIRPFITRPLTFA